VRHGEEHVAKLARQILIEKVAQARGAHGLRDRVSQPAVEAGVPEVAAQQVVLLDKGRERVRPLLLRKQAQANARGSVSGQVLEIDLGRDRVVLRIPGELVGGREQVSYYVGHEIEARRSHGGVKDRVLQDVYQIIHVLAGSIRGIAEADPGRAHILFGVEGVTRDGHVTLVFPGPTAQAMRRLLAGKHRILHGPAAHVFRSVRLTPEDGRVLPRPVQDGLDSLLHAVHEGVAAGRRGVVPGLGVDHVRTRGKGQREE